jgi:transposase
MPVRAFRPAGESDPASPAVVCDPIRPGRPLKLSPEQSAEVRRRWLNGDSSHDLARDFAVTMQTVRNIAMNRNKGGYRGPASAAEGR